LPVSPDLPTLLLVAALLSLAGAATFAFVLDDFSAELRPHVRAWAGALALMGLSWVLLAGRGVLPDAMSIVVSNVTLLASLLLQVRALRGFFGLPPWRARHALLLLAQVLTSVVFTWGIDSAALRMLLGSVIMGVVLLDACWVLFKRGERPASRGHRLLLAYLLALLATLLWRGVMVLTSADVPIGQLLVMPANLMAHALAATLPLVGSVGFLLMLHHRLARRLQAQAAQDALTGLSNLRGFEHAAAARWEHGEALALLAVDADHFKRINDAHGHATGDAVLRWLGQQLTETARQHDVVARLGGEEFVLLLPNSTLEQALAAAERLRERVAQQPFDEDGVRLRVTVSIGVATRREDDPAVDAVLRRADRALYAAKAAGRNRVMFEP
jgi:diguanylate cyclase (GGDEF)-like protein